MNLFTMYLKPGTIKFKNVKPPLNEVPSKVKHVYFIRQLDGSEFGIAPNSDS